MFTPGVVGAGGMFVQPNVSCMSALIADVGVSAMTKLWEPPAAMSTRVGLRAGTSTRRSSW